jgi:hypothetical protein
MVFKALIYGVGCHSVSIVPLPLNHGINSMISLDDLSTNWWLEGGPYGGQMGNNLINLSVYRMTFTHFPSISNLELNNAYTIFRPKFPISKNVLLEKLFGITDCKRDVLVMKHLYDNLNRIVDIQEMK